MPAQELLSSSSTLSQSLKSLAPLLIAFRFCKRLHKKKTIKKINNCAGLIGGVRLETVHFLPELRGAAEAASQASVPLHDSSSLPFNGFSWCLLLLPGNTKGNK